MNIHENAANSCTVGGAEIIDNHDLHITMDANKCKDKMEIAELIGSLSFIVVSLDEAAREAAVAADAICDKNIIAGRYHVQRFAAHARAATLAFRDIIDGEAA